MQLHSQAIDWEVVESHTVKPVRVPLEKDASLVSVAPHEIQGVYTFDMKLPKQKPLASRPRSVHEALESPGQQQSLLTSRPSTSKGSPDIRRRSAILPSASPLTKGKQLRGTCSPRSSTSTPASPNSQPVSLPEAQQPTTSRLSHAFSFLKPRRRLSESSESSNSGTSDGEISTEDSKFSSAGSTPRSDYNRPLAMDSPARECFTKDPHHKNNQLRKALRVARGEMKKQVELTGQNFLVLEGWDLTILRQGERYRIQIEYRARGASVKFSENYLSEGQPPFMEVLNQIL